MNIYDKSYISKKAVESDFNRDTYEKVLRLVDVLEFINQDDFLKGKLALKDELESVRKFVEELMKLTVDEQSFIENFSEGKYSPELLFDAPEVIDRISDYPMAKWKVGKLKKTE